MTLAVDQRVQTNTCPDDSAEPGASCEEFRVSGFDTLVIGQPDVAHFRAYLLGRELGEKCALCPLPAD